MFSWYSTSQFLGSTLKIPFFLENGQVENHTLAAYGLRFMNLWSKYVETNWNWHQLLSILTIVWKAISLIFDVNSPCFILEDPNFILEDREIPVKKKRENYTRCSGLASGTRLTRVKQMMPKNNEFLHVETHFRVKSFVFWYQSYWKNKNKKTYDIEVWIETQGNNEKFILTSPAPDPKNWSPRFDDPKTRGPRNTRVWKQPHWKANVQPN